MPRILVVEDDVDQLIVRKQVLEHAGYEVVTAENASDAVARLAGCQMVLMDLKLPNPEDGMQLIQAASGCARIIVLSGAEPEGQLPVDEFLIKPCSSRKLLETIARFFMLLFCFAAALYSESFKVSAARCEVVAEFDLAAPGTDWAQSGHEAGLATVIVDGDVQQQIMLYAGAAKHTYAVFLGALAAGRHDVQVVGDGVRVMKSRFREDASDVVANAPVLYARANTIGKYTDVPLILYCERAVENGETRLQYTAIFSNEDGGTSTRALMARWGRTTDIEYVYRAVLVDGVVRRMTIQGKDHKELEFGGKRDGLHPLLTPITDNNMIGEAAGSASIRYQIAPLLVELAGHSREEVMDQNPIAYHVMAKELKREGKLRPFGSVDGEKVSDPINYLYLEMKLASSDSSVAAVLRLGNDPRWYSSNLGHADYAIRTSKRNSAESAGGFVRTAIELPPDTKADQIAEIGFQCVVPEKATDAPCRVEAVTKCFFLDRDYKPGPSIWTLTESQEIASGRTWTSALK